MSAAPPRMSTRELNRATLARQALLERVEAPVTQMVERLAGMQAQEARPPFVGLWTRLRAFDPDDVRVALHDGSLVRAPWLRATLHLVSADDYRAHRSALRPALAAAIGVLGARADGLDVDALIPAAQEILRGGPLTFNELRPRLAERFPEVNERALGYATRTQLPLIMVPTDDPWGFPRTASFAPATHRLTGPLNEDPDPRPLLRAYLAAFGPASAADAQTWSGLAGLAPVLESMAQDLVVLRNERGTTLYDLPDAPRPGADVDAPARLLPDFDNLVLAHADRSRVVADDHRPHLVTRNLRVRATFLIDGTVAGTWSVAMRRGVATMVLAPFGRMSRAALRDIGREAGGLLSLVEPRARDHAVVVEPTGG